MAGGRIRKQARPTRISSEATSRHRAASCRRSTASSPFVDDDAIARGFVGDRARDPALRPERGIAAGEYVGGAGQIGASCFAAGAEGELLRRCVVVNDDEKVDVAVG